LYELGSRSPKDYEGFFNLKIMENIYKMELHEWITIENTFIVRVPGGWIYQFTNNSVFVPFNKEFEQKENIEELKINLDFSLYEFLYNYNLPPRVKSIIFAYYPRNTNFAKIDVSDINIRELSKVRGAGKQTIDFLVKYLNEFLNRKI